ncbi:hypothetical protein [Nocardia coubleae]|uniref:S1 motif domain-containing protein n=1 Tax=Nocardia coubleae TaxID=356147 RepID=A0A846W1E4_9NOCA|nr:hypothetical protein [Nocardia coubleae]NKX86845.1 hypothetical protein [Nocardia coubleae]
MDKLTGVPEQNNEDRLSAPYSWDHLSDDPSVWDRVRANHVLGQRLTGTVAQIPRPGAIGIFIDLGLPVSGFVDVLLLPNSTSKWPIEGTVTEFLVWWMDPNRPQIRLVPAESCYRREDFATWCLAHAPLGDPRVLDQFRFDP